jgi:RNA polymerase sigma factor (sigma-70 family)
LPFLQNGSQGGIFISGIAIQISMGMRQGVMGTITVRMPGSKGKIRHTAVVPVRELTARFAETGETASFDELVRRYSAYIYSSCYQITKDRHDAEDATQIAFLQLAVAIKSGSKIEKPVGWLQSVARRQAMRIIRGKSRARRRERKVSKDEMHTANLGTAMDESTIAGIVRDALDDLPERYRLPLVLHYFSGMSLETIAAELKSNPRTVATRLHRGRKLLGRKLNKSGLRLDGDALATILAVVIPSLIVRSISKGVTVASNSPGGLPASIMHTVQLSALAATKRKLAVAAMLLAGASASVALAKSLGSFSFPQVGIQHLFRWMRSMVSPEQPIKLLELTEPEGRVDGMPDTLTQDEIPWSPEVTTPLNLTGQKTSFNGIGRKVVPLGKDDVPVSESNTEPTHSGPAWSPLVTTKNEGTPKSKTISKPDESQSIARRSDPDKLQFSQKETTRSEATMLSSGSASANLSGTHANLVVPPFADHGQKFRGYGDVDITGSFIENGRVVADGGNSGRQLNLSKTPPVQNTVDNPPSGSNGWYAVNGGKLTLPPLHVDSADKSYTWGESNEDPQLDLINSVRMRVSGLRQPGDVSLSLENLNSDPKAFGSLPGGWGVIGLWQIDADGMRADSIDLTVRYNQIAAAYLPMGNNLLTFLTYDGQWEAMDFSQVKLDLADHLITGSFDEPFGYFAVAGPLDPFPDQVAQPLLGTIAPEPATGMVLFTSMAMVMSRRRRNVRVAK